MYVEAVLWVLTQHTHLCLDITSVSGLVYNKHQHTPKEQLVDNRKQQTSKHVHRPIRIRYVNMITSTYCTADDSRPQIEVSSELRQHGWRCSNLITCSTFSPEGRLFQVEYSLEAIKLGSTAIGIQTSEGVVLGVEKRVTSSLLETSSVEKIVEIDRHIGCAISGLQADSRTLIEHARWARRGVMITSYADIMEE